MKPNRYKVAATLLGGNYRMGIVGRSRPRVQGRVGDVEYTLTSTWELETRKEAYGLVRRKERKSYETSQGHVFLLRLQWTDQPCTIRRTGGEVEAVAAVPGDEIELTEEQRGILAAALLKWPGLEITNHGVEWVEDERDQTAQEFAITIQGLAGVLDKLPPERDGVFTRVADKTSLPSMTDVAALLKKPLGRGSTEEADPADSDGSDASDDPDSEPPPEADPSPS